MTLVRVSGPDAEPVTVAELKLHLRLAHDSEDDLLAGLIRAAREDVERATGMALIEQRWRLVLDAWPDSRCVMLMRHPVREVLGITVYDTNGLPTVLQPGDYQTDLVSRPARIAVGDALPQARAMNGIDIEFAVGFGEAGPDVPDPLRQAITYWHRIGMNSAPAMVPTTNRFPIRRSMSG